MLKPVTAICWMNFPLILLILTVVTGIFWVLERRSFLPARKARAE